MSKIKNYYEDIYGEDWSSRIDEIINDKKKEETNGRPNN